MFIRRNLSRIADRLIGVYNFKIVNSEKIKFNPYLNSVSSMNHFKITIGNGIKQMEVYYSCPSNKTFQITLMEIITDILQMVLDINISFEDWCRQYEFIDLEEAFKIYNYYKETAVKFKALIGSAEYNSLMHELFI